MNFWQRIFGRHFGTVASVVGIVVIAGLISEVQATISRTSHPLYNINTQSSKEESLNSNGIAKKKQLNYNTEFDTVENERATPLLPSTYIAGHRNLKKRKESKKLRKRRRKKLKGWKKLHGRIKSSNNITDFTIPNHNAQHPHFITKKRTKTKKIKDKSHRSSKSRKKSPKFQKLRSGFKRNRGVSSKSLMGSIPRRRSHKRLNSNPRHRIHSLLNHRHDYMRSLHHQHNQITASIRNRLHNHIEQTRRNWINNINPHKMLQGPFSSFPELPNQIIPTIPVFTNFKNNKRDWETTTKLPRSFINRRKFGVPSIFLPKDRKLKPPLSLTPKRNIFTHKEEKKQFTPGTVLEPRSVKPTSKLLPSEVTTKSTKVSNNDEFVYISYGKDTFNGKRNDAEQTDSSETEWEWVPLDSKREKDQDKNNDEDEKEEDKSEENPDGREKPDVEEEPKEKPEEREYPDKEGEPKENPEKEERQNGEDENEVHPETDIEKETNLGDIEPKETHDKEEDPETALPEDIPEFDVDRCLECPPKRKIFIPEDKDFAPLIIPTPKNNCLDGNVLRFHVEVNPTLESNSLSGDRKYSINVTIMGGPSQSTPLKSCIFEYVIEVSKCDLLQRVPDGRVNCSDGQNFGSKCKWTCDAGKNLVGPSEAECDGDKRQPHWSNRLPKCEESGCQIPKALDGASLSCTVPIPDELLFDKLDSMKFYPKGTNCLVRCNNELNTVVRSKCLTNGKWSPDISNCCSKKTAVPKPMYGECRDMNIQITGPGTVHLIPPRFVTANGKAASVWCDMDTVRNEGRQCRDCKARDLVTGLAASCQQCINVSSNLGCPSIKSPQNGSLSCKNTAGGDILCKITCKDGFLSPPELSSGVVRCPRGSGLWNFQSHRNELLPNCVLR